MPIRVGGSTPSASSEGFWAQKATPDNLGKVLPSRRRVAWRLRGLGAGSGCFCKSLARLADDWQAGQSPTVKVQASKPTPRGQAGPKTARRTPQNKAMVRPNPINRPQSTRRYPGRSRHAHWLGFSGVARPAGIVDCGFAVGAGVLECLITIVSLSSPFYSPYHIPGSHRSRGENHLD